VKVQLKVAQSAQSSFMKEKQDAEKLKTQSVSINLTQGHDGRHLLEEAAVKDALIKSLELKVKGLSASIEEDKARAPKQKVIEHQRNTTTNAASQTAETSDQQRENIGDPAPNGQVSCEQCKHCICHF
jgi:hypothetical protein